MLDMDMFHPVSFVTVLCVSIQVRYEKKNEKGNRKFYNNLKLKFHTVKLLV